MNTRRMVSVMGIVFLVLTVAGCSLFTSDRKTDDDNNDNGYINTFELCYLEDTDTFNRIFVYDWTEYALVDDWVGESYTSSKSLLLRANSVSGWPVIKMYGWGDHPMPLDWSSYDRFVVDLYLPEDLELNPESRDLQIMLEFVDSTKEGALYQKFYTITLGESVCLSVPLSEIEENTQIELDNVNVWGLQVQSTGSFAIYIDNIMLVSEAR